MATATPIAYNPSLSFIPGTQQIGVFSVGTPTSGFTGNPKWWNSPDLELGYVIGIPVSGNTQPTPVSGVTASLGFYRSSALTETAFVELSEYLTGQSFGDGNDAEIYLEDTLGYYTSWTGAPQSFYITNSAQTTSLSSYTFNSISIGGPGLIVLTVGAKRLTYTGDAAYNNVTSIVVNGINATLHQNRGQGINGSTIASVRITGNTNVANIDVNFGYLGDGVTLGIHRIINNISDTPLDSNQSKISTIEFSDAYTLNFPSSNPKVAIGTTCSTNSPSANVTFTNLTKNFQVNNSKMLMSSGSIRITNGTTSLFQGYTFDTDLSVASMCGAIWN
jgi:hypothetical protein